MIVIKYGGHAMADKDGLFARAVQSCLDAGQECVIVHGGGPAIDAGLKKAGVSSSFIGGFRVTSPEAFEVIQNVLTGQVLRQVVAQLRQAGINAVGVSGRDGGLLVARKLRTLVDGTSADLGQVGEVIRVDTALVRSLLHEGFVPVVSPISVEGDEESENSNVGLNVNADLAGAALAGALGAQTYLVLTDVAGIYRSWPDLDSLISKISADELRSIKDQFGEGMAPKVLACLNAIDAGAHSVRIIDGTDPESFALALRGIGGTLVTQ